jgi:hypothetical protein
MWRLFLACAVFPCILVVAACAPTSSGQSTSSQAVPVSPPGSTAGATVDPLPATPPLSSAPPPPISDPAPIASESRDPLAVLDGEALRGIEVAASGPVEQIETATAIRGFSASSLQAEIVQFVSQPVTT